MARRSLVRAAEQVGLQRASALLHLSKMPPTSHGGGWLCHRGRSTIAVVAALGTCAQPDDLIGFGEKCVGMASLTIARR